MNSSSIRVRVELRIHGVGSLLGEALAKAIAPDDATAPQWMNITESVEGEDLIVIVEATIPAERMGSIRNTVDEILEFLYATLKSLEELEKRRTRKPVRY